MLKKIAIALAVLIAGVLAFAATRPDRYRVERSARVGAAPELVFAQLDDWKAWAEWSPWDKLDPKMTKTESGPPRAVGSSYTWSGNSDVGKGKMTIVEHAPPRHIAYDLEFIEPFQSRAKTTIDVEPDGGASKVTWAMEGNNDYMGKLFGLFMDMDAMIGKDFEKGLAQLDSLVKTRAPR